MRRLLFALSALVLATAPARAEEPAPKPIEPAALAREVNQFQLPRVEERIPTIPRICPPIEGGRIGHSGGSISTLIGTNKDLKLIGVYGYARLVTYTPDLQLVPDIARAIDVSDGGATYTIHLRPGHRWSNGSPFTTEDFRYWWEDVANNEELSPLGPPPDMLVKGTKPQVDFIDDVTVRFRWPAPNPGFLPHLAGALPLQIFLPKQYLKQFHKRYAEPNRLSALVESNRARNWAALHDRLSSLYRNDNPELPTLNPWMLQTKPPSDRYVFKRNPFFHRLDSAGNQLPYLDEIDVAVADGKIIAAKTAAGESDLQARGLGFGDTALLKSEAADHRYKVRLWRSARGAQIALYPNLNAADAVWRDVLRDVRVRRALSLAIDRHEINQVVYYGLADETGNSVLPGSPLFDPANATAWTKHDPELANRLLDEAGLDKRDDNGLRLLPDGRPAIIIIETAGGGLEETDVLQLIRDSWTEVGIKLLIRPAQLALFRKRVFSGLAIMSVEPGAENGWATPNLSPAEWVPSSDQQLQWPQWGKYVATSSKIGSGIEDKQAARLVTLWRAWQDSTDEAERTDLWRQILRIQADQAYVIGVVSNVPVPIVVRDGLENLPTEGRLGWEPGALLGIYHPDMLFWARPDVAAVTSKGARP